MEIQRNDRLNFGLEILKTPIVNYLDEDSDYPNYRLSRDLNGDPVLCSRRESVA